MKKFAVATITLPDYPHSQAFAEIMEAFHYGLLELGVDSVLTTDLGLADRQYIIFGSNLLPYANVTLPPSAILYNLEQVYTDSFWFHPDWIDVIKQYTVWDYSLQNIEQWKALGIPNVRHVPIGYVPALTRIESAPEEDIDVLFYGSTNDRRVAIIEALQAHQVNVVSLFGAYGQERDQVIARAKIILNVHYHDAKVFEIARVFYLLANKRFVVSEYSGASEYTDLFKMGIAFAPYDNIVATCLHFLEHPEARALVARRGFELMQSHPQSKYLQFVAED